MNNQKIAVWAMVGIMFFGLAVAAGYALLEQPLDSSEILVSNPVSAVPASQGAGPVAKKPAALPKMMEIFAEWCPPCKQMKPIINDLEKEYRGKVKFVRVDVDKSPDVAKKYKVDAVPVQLFFDKNGKQVFRHVGFYSKDQIRAQFKKMEITPAK